ncbi:hypothetical protein [Pedobacter sp. V48]|uniref:hypothetical protein n=1 Tax=Pedobacter sp. V48 TaxID=509635 RepID=UPI0003E51028|nr:hypothetical protein [Pedobacter sp. V48]ETZ22825.1 hypothetical protein N824_21285 [Pedobacter sp. V48]
MTKIIFKSPGEADNLPTLLLEKWNEEIQRQYSLLETDLGSKFFHLDPAEIQNSIVVNSVKWFGDPAEPAFCQSADVAQKLSDWGIKGRHNLHNEYCEYTIEYRTDSQGKLRPKRVQITTELREYWVTIAKHDPDLLKQLATSVLNYQVTWDDLYGNDPIPMTIQQREISFSTQVAGNGNEDRLIQLGVPSQPVGKINRENAFFMTHPINGLDDLLYIVMFGAKPYARKNGATFEKVQKESIFKTFNVQQLACRHADPAAAMGAYGAVFEGRHIAFNEALGMYIQSFSKNNFAYNGNAIPDAWVQFSRGHQRLVFGPSDAEEVYLDDITLDKGGVDVSIKGGFEVLQQIEVGPLIQLGEATELDEGEYVILTESDAPIVCGQASICKLIKKLLTEYENGGLVLKSSPRNVDIII